MEIGHFDKDFIKNKVKNDTTTQLYFEWKI